MRDWPALGCRISAARLPGRRRSVLDSNCSEHRGSEENAMTLSGFYRIVAIAMLAGLLAFSQNVPDVRKLSLKEAEQLALGQNRSLRIARLRVAENEQQKAGERSAYF